MRSSEAGGSSCDLDGGSTRSRRGAQTKLALFGRIDKSIPFAAREIPQRMRFQLPVAVDVDDVPAAVDPLIRDQAPMAAPPEGFGAENGGRPLGGPRDQLVPRPPELLGRPVVGV